MNDMLAIRVRAAAVAGWWTVLIAAGFITLLWAIYLLMMAQRPAWILAMWRPGADWPEVQHVCLGAIVTLKFVVWLMTLAVIWLTLWGRQLSKRAGAG